MMPFFANWSNTGIEDDFGGKNRSCGRNDVLEMGAKSLSMT